MVRSVLGGIAGVTDELEVGTAVTCSTVRMHPAIGARVPLLERFYASGSTQSTTSTVPVISKTLCTWLGPWMN